MPQESRPYQLFVGSYSAAAEEGLRILAFDPEHGKLQHLQGLSGIDSPSFLAFDAQRSRLYAVSETGDGNVQGGAVVAVRVDPASGQLTEINRQPTYGDHPCHLAIDPSGEWLLLVNYTGGSIAVYPIDGDGALGPVSQKLAHAGSSVNAERQEGPHPHAIYAVPGTDCYLVNDLGTDTVYAYRLDRQQGALLPHRETKVEPGVGPRHLAIHPTRPIVYVIEELTSAIAVFAFDASEGSLTHLQTVSTLPDSFAGESTCAEVAVSRDGKYVYGSNRGHDSIASFRVGADGLLEPIGHTPSGGKTPRNFLPLPDGKWLLAANQDSDWVAVLSIDADGYPTPTDEGYAMRKPVCIRLR
ncbi:lactonase family protein [Cohnella nanjingensis]|uniref:Lactonase family protein n=1 Tax=Cohnella nanjingensis TaxID=1387779 RepID=A0A7X0VFQ3_9BACL|nr:lactonase family protein [Cohnella nanjingensis]MBB6671528.1 lactonase family protein [Cohnella nanjingensis]